MINRKIIGTTHYVGLPDYTDRLIPAKIDTGADSSAIWASSILESEGELSFVLFNVGSEFYNGNVIKTKQYAITSVKNSFGRSEFRYRVKLRIKIDNKIYLATFSLADRENSRFPILIGKRLLKNKFIVDVARKDIQRDSNLIVILKSVIGTTKSEQLKTELARQASSEFVLSDYKSLRFEIDETGARILLADGRDIAKAKVVYFKSHNLFTEHASAVARYLKYKHVRFLDKEVGNFVSTSKLSEMLMLSTSNIPVPKSIIYGDFSNIPSYDEIKQRLGASFVAKDAMSDRGKNNFLICSQESFNEAMARFKGVGTVIFQQYIENDGFLRVLLLDGNVIQVVKRNSAKHHDPLRAHLNKPNGGGNAVELEESEYDPETIVLARRASLILKRDIVGVDIVRDKNTQRWYVLEANNNPEILGGINVAKKINGLVRLLESKD